MTDTATLYSLTDELNILNFKKKKQYLNACLFHHIFKFLCEI